MRRLRNIALALALAPLLGSCAQQETVTDQDVMLDTLATRIKTEMINQVPTDAAAVEVQQQGGVIYLRGFADSKASRQRMEEIAREASGDRRIVNQIRVK